MDLPVDEKLLEYIYLALREKPDLQCYSEQLEKKHPYLKDLWWAKQKIGQRGLFE